MRHTLCPPSGNRLDVHQSKGNLVGFVGSFGNPSGRSPSGKKTRNSPRESRLDGHHDLDVRNDRAVR